MSASATNALLTMLLDERERAMLLENPQAAGARFGLSQDELATLVSADWQELTSEAAVAGRVHSAACLCVWSGA
jgi:hypothetical protein